MVNAIPVNVLFMARDARDAKQAIMVLVKANSAASHVVAQCTAQESIGNVMKSRVNVIVSQK